MQIKQVMQRYGYTPASLAKKMGVYVSTVSRLIDGNPTVEKLNELARWIGCQRWEFFADEMQAAGMQVVPNGAEPAQPSQQRTAISQQAIICPHCHSALVFKIEAYGESK